MKTITFTRVNNDTNGNGRLVCHFYSLLSDKENDFNIPLEERYNIAVKRANKIGGKRFNNKQFGGGIVFQDKGEKYLTERINNLIKSGTN